MNSFEDLAVEYKRRAKELRESYYGGYSYSGAPLYLARAEVYESVALNIEQLISNSGANSEEI